MSSTSPFRNIDLASGEHLTKRAWWLIVLTLFIPGSAQLIAGNRKFGRIGIVVDLAYWILIALAAVTAILDRSALIYLATMPVFDTIAAAFLVIYSILFALFALDTLRLIRVNRLPGRAKWVSLAALLIVAVFGTSSFAYAATLAGAQSSLMGGLFTQQGSTAAVDGRYNILLLGADSGRGRFGIRPDSMSVLSIDASTGKTVNIGLPRNLQKAPFAAGSPMATVYPTGFNCGDTCLLNAIYTDATNNHSALYPNAAAQGTTAGVQATKEAIEGVTGLTIQSYIMIDMAGFKALINAIGGITINVTQRLPIGGQQDALGNPINVQGWIEPGLQHMDGETAIWYARSRHSTSDYDRMQRQRQVEDAMLAQLNPADVLTHFKDIASAGKQLLRTDIPNSMVATYIDLAMKAKKSGTTKLELIPPTIDVVNPNFSAIHAMVQTAIKQAASGK